MAPSTDHMTMQDLKEIIVTERDGVTANELKEAAKLSPSPIDLLGTWVNMDSHTGGIVKLILGFAGALRVHAYGACHPTPCDWGTVNGLTYSNGVSSSRAVAFSAIYQFSFKSTIVTGKLQSGMLIVEVFNHFTDASGRFDYYDRYTMRRA
jgi:hypothetical protein